MNYVMFVLFAAAIYLLIRNQMVYSFRTKINEMCHAYSLARIRENNFSDDAYRWCYDKLPSYSDMMFSFKPLRLENWMPIESVIKLINP